MAIHYDPNAPDKTGTGEYEYGRKFFDGDQRVVVLWGRDKKTAEGGDDMIELTLGFRGPEGGVKVDHRLVDGSKFLREAVQAFLPGFKGGALTGKMFKDAVAIATIASRQYYSKKLERDVVAPDVKALRALTPAEASQARPAPAQAQPQQQARSSAPPASAFGDA